MDSDMTREGAVADAPETLSNAFSAIPVTVQVMLGTATLPLSELMQLRPGSEIKLDQSVGEQVVVIVNGTRIAEGELYVLESENDRLGVRIARILSAGPA
jgi:flagellar motor switch protein FliN